MVEGEEGRGMSRMSWANGLFGWVVLMDCLL